MSYKDELIAASKGGVSVRLVTEVEEGRLALFPELVEACKSAYEEMPGAPLGADIRQLLRAVLVKAGALEKEAKG